MRQWALHYAKKGLAVFPLQPRDKIPATQNGFKDATTDSDKVYNWWEQNPDYNIGIATGQVSGGLVVIDLDIDEEKGKNGYEVLKEWQREHGELPETWQSITGRGGYHLFYKSSEKEGNRGGLYDGVDIRGDGGYIVAPPSLHPNGNRYEWEQSLDEYPLAEVNDLVRAFLHPVKEQQSQAIKPISDTIPEGTRVDTLVKLVCSQVAKGLSDEAIRAAVKAENEIKCVPPLTDEELEKTVFPALKRYQRGTSPYTNMQVMPSPGQMPAAISAAVLMDMDIPPIGWLVDGMIPPGLDLLIGASKIGKSWMALQMCIAIASGEPFMGRKTKKTKVLYLSLEDSYRRIQNRMKRQLQGKPVPENLYFITDALPLGSGLLEQIDPYVKDGVEVIIIDTLQKIRGANGNKNAYAADYEDMSILKRYADEHDMAIIPVHHTRKMKDDDVFNMVSGTNGIMGAADTTIILQKDKRADTKATMHITGRDVLTDELAVDFNRDTCTWESLGSKEDLEKQMEDFNYRHDPIVETIKEILENYNGWQGTATEFQNEMMNRHKGYIENAEIGRRFRKLKQGLYENDHIIYEEPSGSTANRRHKFKKEELLIK